MMNMVAAELSRIPMSANLAATLSRATDYARAQLHLEVTLEHLLLALIEDPEAGMVLAASAIDPARLSADVSDHLGRIEERAPADQPGQLVVSTDLRRILEAAAAAAQQGRRRDINGAIVLAAVVGDGRSAAAHLLSAHGLTFEGAIQALQRVHAPAAAQSAPAAPQPAPAQPVPQSTPQSSPAAPSPTHDNAVLPSATPTAGRAAAARSQSMDELLAEARERVRKRHANAEPETPAEHAPAPTESAAASEPPAAAPPHQASYQPEWHEAEAPVAAQPAPSAVYPSPPSPAEPEPLSAPPRHGPPAGTMPGPRHGGQSAGPPAAPSSRQASPPHRPQPAGGASPYGAPPAATDHPPPPGSWTPAMPPVPAGAHPPRPVRQPPPLPLPPAPRPGSVQLPPRPFAGDGGPRGRASPMGEEMAPEPRRPAPAPQGRPRPGPAVEIGQLVENIPKTMRVGIPERVEVRIGKASVKALAEGLQGGGAAWRHEVMVTKAMSVRLRAPEGGFFIESASPETQWIESALGLMADDFASWRWTVTPRERGWKRLQLVVSARTVGADGLAAETALPDQIIDVRVRTNYGKAAITAGGWAAAAVAGGLLAKFGEGVFSAIWRAAVRAVAG